MIDEEIERAPARMRPRPRPSHVYLEQDWGSHLAGKVLAVDDDLLAKLDAEGVKYREPTAFELSIGVGGSA
jgi:hypothetical protein